MGLTRGTFSVSSAAALMNVLVALIVALVIVIVRRTDVHSSRPHAKEVP